MNLINVSRSTYATVTNNRDGEEETIRRRRTFGIQHCEMSIAEKNTKLWLRSGAVCVEHTFRYKSQLRTSHARNQSTFSLPNLVGKKGTNYS
jgi:hypothetical protein